MLELTGGALNLPVSIENLLKFGRMKRFKPASAIVAALRESKFLEVAGAKGQESVKRKVPFTEEDRPKAESRSVYVKGFGDEEPSSQFDIEAFFGNFPTYRIARGQLNQVLTRDISTIWPNQCCSPSPY
jgi:lupus La protein